MINYRKFTDKEIKEICKNMVILIDTREQTTFVEDWCSHRNRCEFKKQKLDQGDYSFYVKAIPELGITHDMYFDKHIVIEKKNSLDELSQNFTKSRTRFEEELAIYKGKMLILINDKWVNLFEGNYNSKYNRKSFVASIMSFEHRYNLAFKCIEVEEMPKFIYSYFLYFLKEVLKNS